MTPMISGYIVLYTQSNLLLYEILLDLHTQYNFFHPNHNLEIPSFLFGGSLNVYTVVSCSDHIY